MFIACQAPRSNDPHINLKQWHGQQLQLRLLKHALLAYFMNAAPQPAQTCTACIAPYDNLELPAEQWQQLQLRHACSHITCSLASVLH